MSETLQSLKTRVHALREAMNAARLDYLRGQLQLYLMQGRQTDADRATKQVRNLLNKAKPRTRKTKATRPGGQPASAMPTQCALGNGRNASASSLNIKAAAAASE